MPFSNEPILLSSFDSVMPISIACGSYHTLILSKGLPKIENPSLDN